MNSHNDYFANPMIPGDATLLLGLFIPIQNGGWSPSLAERDTDWTFEYNLGCVRKAEAIGFDFVFGLGQYHRKGGWGGQTDYHEHHLDPLVTTAALAAATERISLISTTHVLYSWHPTMIAKLTATIDHISQGRFGLNIVTGFKPFEFEMFGMEPVPHQQRYPMASEFMDQVIQLWRSEENLTITGEHWSMRNAFVSPKPVRGRPLIVSAGSSPAGLKFAADYCDMLFITSPVGYPAGIEATIEALPDYIDSVRATTPSSRPPLKLVINPHIVSRSSEKESKAYYRRIADAADVGAVRAIQGQLAKGDQGSWKREDPALSQAVIDATAVGGNVIITGSPEQVVEHLIKLRKCGVDGIQINFFDYGPDLEHFETEILPLMKEAGLR